MMLEPLAVKLLDKHYELEDALTLEGNSFSLRVRLILRRLKAHKAAKKLESLYRK